MGQVRPNYAQCPMFRALGVKSNSWQWHAPEIRDTIDTLDAMRLEKAVAALPGQAQNRYTLVVRVPVAAGTAHVPAPGLHYGWTTEDVRRQQNNV